MDNDGSLDLLSEKIFYCISDIYKWFLINMWEKVMISGTLIKESFIEFVKNEWLFTSIHAKMVV